MSTSLQLERLNSQPTNEAKAEFLKCCGSERWARRMVNERPFTSFDQLLESADRIWWSLEPRDWLEAFRSHPKIGEQKAEQQTSAETQQWSEQEQSGTRSAGQQTLNALADLNRKYEEKFGYIFIVCATGKTSAEILAILRHRLENNSEAELRNAATEQAQITGLRMKKLIDNA